MAAVPHGREPRDAGAEVVTAILWPVACVIVAAIVHNIAARWLGQRELDRKHNEALREHFDQRLVAHESKHSKALANLVEQVREEVDAQSAEVAACAGWVKTKIGLAGDDKLEPWQRNAQTRKQQIRQHRRES